MKIGLLQNKQGQYMPYLGGRQSLAYKDRIIYTTLQSAGRTPNLLDMYPFNLHYPADKVTEMTDVYLEVLKINKKIYVYNEDINCTDFVDLGMIDLEVFIKNINRFITY